MTANDEPETTSMPQFTFRPFSAVVAAFRQVDSAIREQDPRGDRDELGLVMGLDRWPDLDRISDVFYGEWAHSDGSGNTR